MRIHERAGAELVETMEICMRTRRLLWKVRSRCLRSRLAASGPGHLHLPHPAPRPRMVEALWQRAASPSPMREVTDERAGVRSWRR